MNCQMIRVISSPSSSTTGFWTLIFAMVELLARRGTCTRLVEVSAAVGAVTPRLPDRRVDDPIPTGERPSRDHRSGGRPAAERAPAEPPDAPGGRARVRGDRVRLPAVR